MPPIRLADERIAALSQLWKAVLSEPPSQNLNELWKDHLRIREVLEVAEDEEPYDFRQQLQRPGRDECVEKLQTWLKDQQVDFSAVELRPVAYGYGLFAVKDLNAEDVPLTMPHNALLSLDYGASCSPIRDMHESDQLLSSMSNVSLAMIVAYVLLSRDEQFTPYINALPSTYHTPLFFTTTQLLALKPSPAFRSALMLFRSVARHYVYFLLRIMGAKTNSKTSFDFKRSPFNSDKFTFGLYRWCVCTVSTRLNHVPSSKQTNADGTPALLLALVPLIDFANFESADFKSASMLADGHSHQILLQMAKSVSRGDEIFLNYGQRTNAEFLIHNGFVPTRQNRGNTYEITFGFAKSADAAEKQRHLKSNDIRPESGGFYTFVLDDCESRQAAIEETSLWKFATVFVASSIDELDSAETRAKARTFLLQRIQLLQRAYASISSDELENADHISCYIWRLHKSELELLKAYEAKLEALRP